MKSVLTNFVCRQMMGHKPLEAMNASVREAKERILSAQQVLDNSGFKCTFFYMRVSR